MQLPPVAVIESWPPSNYENPDTTGDANIVISAVFVPLVYAIIAVRCYTRLRISRSFGWDDWLILAAVVYYLFSLCQNMELTLPGPYDGVYSSELGR